MIPILPITQGNILVVIQWFYLSDKMNTIILLCIEIIINILNLSLGIIFTIYYYFNHYSWLQQHIFNKINYLFLRLPTLIKSLY